MPLNQEDYLNVIKQTSYLDSLTIQKSNLFFIGIDPSITNTGLVILNEAGVLCGAFNFRKIFVKLHRSIAYKESTIKRIYKMDNILRHILQMLNEANNNIKPNLFIGIEGYSYGSIGKLAQIGELCGSYKLIALSWGVDCLVIPPNNVKKYATGSGLADKQTVMQYASKELSQYGLTAKQFTSDICDAYFIASITYGVNQEINKETILCKQLIKEDVYLIRSNIIQQGKLEGFNGKHGKNGKRKEREEGGETK